MEPTPTQRLATLKLERDVVEWVAERRGAAPSPSYRAIATELRLLTGVDVTDETVRLWCASYAEQASAGLGQTSHQALAAWPRPRRRSLRA